MRYLVGALSVPSMTISHPCTISWALSFVSLVSYVSTLMWWLKAKIDSFAEIVLSFPMFYSVWITYLWRLDSSTISPSTSPIVPTPAPARMQVTRSDGALMCASALYLCARTHHHPESSGVKCASTAHPQRHLLWLLSSFSASSFLLHLLGTITM